MREMNTLLALLAVLLLHALQTSSAQLLQLKRFEVIRVNPDDLRRLPRALASLFGDPVPDGEMVDSVDEAAKRSGFAPRLLSGKTPKRLFATNAVNQEATISVAELAAALKEAGSGDVAVPANWEGVVLRLQQAPGILVDYGDFYIAEAAPTTLSAPPDFPLPQFFEVLFRAMNVSAGEARASRDRFAAGASVFVPIPKRFDMDIHQVPLTSGSGLLLQNAEKGGELAFMWSTGSRSYFLTGLVTEEEAIALAKSLQ